MRKTTFIIIFISLIISAKAQFQASLGMGMPKTEIWVDYIETSFIFPTVRGGEWIEDSPPENMQITYGNNIPFYLKFAGKYKRLGYGVNINHGNFTYTERTYDYVYYNPNLMLLTSKSIESISTAINLKVAAFVIDKTKFNLYFALGLGVGHVKQSRSLYTFTNGVDYQNFNGATLGMELGLGVNYYFYENFGLYLETGFSKSMLQFGVVYKTKMAD